MLKVTVELRLARRRFLEFVTACPRLPHGGADGIVLGLRVWSFGPFRFRVLHFAFWLVWLLGIIGASRGFWGPGSNGLGLGRCGNANQQPRKDEPGVNFELRVDRFIRFGIGGSGIGGFKN